MTDHSINIMVSSSLARQCYPMLMLMTLWWLSALIQMTSTDILELGSQSDIGMLWHILSLARSSADGWSSTCCVISHSPLTGIRLGWTPSALSKARARPSATPLKSSSSFCYYYWRCDHVTLFMGNLCDAICPFCLGYFWLHIWISSHIRVLQCSRVASGQDSQHEALYLYLGD